MKLTFWTLAAIFTLAGAVACVAQTNPNYATNLPPVPIPVTSATGALGALLHFIFPGASLTSLGAIAGLLIAVSKWLRNVIPDSWQVNKAGLALSVLAGDLNPSMTKQISNAAEEALLAATPAKAAAATPTPTPTVPPTVPKV